MADQAPPTEALRFSHSGERYVLGYGADFFGVWDRTQPGGPIVRFPRNDSGWEQAWKDFTGRERRFVDVGRLPARARSGGGPPAAAPAALRPTAPPAKVTMALIGVSAVLAVLTMAARAGLIARLNEFRRGAVRAAGVIEAGNTVDGLAVATAAMIVVTGIAWVVWQYRAQANLHALGVPGLRYSPTAAAGWWWVPFANLVLPFLTVRELWTHSAPGVGGEPEEPRPGPSRLLAAWWTFWLARIPLGAVVAAVAHGPNATPDQVTLRAYLGLGSDAALVVAAVLAVSIVRRIQHGQDALGSRPAVGSVSSGSA